MARHVEQILSRTNNNIFVHLNPYFPTTPWCLPNADINIYSFKTKHMICMKQESEMRSFKSNENIHKEEGGSYYVVSANKASSVTLQSPGNKSQRKQTAILRILNRQSIQRLI